MVYLAVTILDLEHPSSQTPINSHLIIRVIPHRSRPMLAAAAAESWLKAHVTCHGNLWLLVKYQKAKYTAFNLKDVGTTRTINTITIHSVGI